MKLLKITDAKYVEDYKIDLSFNNGVSAIIDLKDTIFLDHRAIFKQLKEIAFFKDFTRNSWTIEGLCLKHRCNRLLRLRS